jgi:hypothetical protein
MGMPERVFGFVLGTGRCGSTLVQEIVARHRDVGFVSNLEDRVGPASMLGRWALAARFRTFFESHATAQGAPVFLHKFTGWPRAGFVAASLSGTRFVHVVRDGRAVAESWLQMPWWRGDRGPEGWHFGPLPPAYAEEWEASGRSQVVLAGLAWKLLLDAFDAAQAATADRPWLVLRYEDVVAEPEHTMRTLLEFLGLEWDTYFVSQLARFRFDRTRLDAYRRDMDPTELSRLEHTLASHLCRYGYEVAA